MGKFLKVVDKLNLNEPSTYAGLATAATTAGMTVPVPYVQPVSFLLAGLFSIIAVLKKEKVNK